MLLGDPGSQEITLEMQLRKRTGSRYISYQIFSYHVSKWPGCRFILYMGRVNSSVHFCVMSVVKYFLSYP